MSAPAFRTWFLTVGLALLASCAGPDSDARTPADHPANADAAQAPLPAPSGTLGAEGAAAAPLPGDGAHAAHGHAGGDGAAGTASPAAAPAAVGHAGHGASTPATRPAATQPTFTCPMHPEFVTTDPEERCPKCKMELRPVKAGTAAPATAPSGPSGAAADHAGHGGHQ